MTQWGRIPAFVALGALAGASVGAALFGLTGALEPFDMVSRSMDGCAVGVGRTWLGWHSRRLRGGEAA